MHVSLVCGGQREICERSGAGGARTLGLAAAEGGINIVEAY